MRILFLAGVISLLFTACNQSRVYEQNTDFDERYWLVNETPEFEFTIDQPADKYTLYCNIRNSVSYPYARLFFTYHLQDSAGTEIDKKLVTQHLFDAKTGKPFGT